MTLSQAPSLKNWTGRDPVLGFEGDIDYFDVLLFKYQSRSHNFKKLFFVPSPEVVQVNDSVITFHYPGTGKALPPYSMNSESKEWSPLTNYLEREFKVKLILEQTVLGGGNSNSNRRSQNEEEFFMDLQQRLNKQYGGMPANLMDNP
nr:unnamed protein product [Naegleria fowleri]